MSLPQSSLPVQLSPVSRNLSVIVHVTMICNCFSPSISLTRWFLFWWQLFPVNSVNYFSWTSNFNHDPMIPPYLLFNNIWKRFFNFLGPFNYENLVHYCYKLESPSESKDSPLPPLSLSTFIPSSLPSRSHGSFSVEDREDGGREKGKVSFLRYTALQADAFCMAGIQILTLLQVLVRVWEELSKVTGRNWYQRITG